MVAAMVEAGSIAALARELAMQGELREMLADFANHETIAVALRQRSDLTNETLVYFHAIERADANSIYICQGPRVWLWASEKGVRPHDL